MDVNDIKTRYEALRAQRRTVESMWQFIEYFVVPFRGEFFQDMSSEHEVEWRRRRIYDATAVQAAQTLASSMQGSLTSPAIKWFDLRFRSDELNKNKSAKEWLEEVGLRIYQALQDSNFDLESAEFYLDLVSYGSGIVTEESEGDTPDTFEGLDFQSVPIRDCFFEQDAKGQILRLYRRIQWTLQQLKDKFGEEALPRTLQERLMGNSDLDRRYDVIFCVYLRDANKDADVSSVLTPDARPYGYKYILHDDASQLGSTGGYYEMPGFVARWRKVCGSQWGHSPATICLSDILTLNELTESTLEALGKVIDPATLATERGLLSDLDLGRGGLTVVRSLDEIQPYESKARFDVGELKIDRLQMSINRAFFVDQLQLKESPAMTATEVQVRYELMQRLLGPTLGRLQNDFLDPLISRTYGILLRAGQLPAVPEVVKSANAELDIEYSGPLPRAQKADTVLSIQKWVGTLVGMREAFPQVMEVPDPDAIAREIGDLSGVPAKLMRDPDEIEKERKKKQRVAEAATSAEIAQKRGDALKAVGEGMAAAEGQPGAEENANIQGVA